MISSPLGPAPLAPTWLTVPNDLNALHRPMWAHTVKRCETGELSIDGISVSTLAQQFGTPLFVLSEADFRACARTFKTAFDNAFTSKVDVYYAGKAFLCTDVARWAIEEGLRLDTCSGGELAVAARAGIPGEYLGLHGNNKSDAEIHRALDMRVGRIVVDSLQEIDKVAAIAASRNERARIMLRITPGVHAHTHEFIATAHEDQKFGLSLVDGVAEAAVLAALKRSSLELVGIHCHIGSQIFDAEGFAVAAERLLAFMAHIQTAYKITLPELDLGGGYGIAYTPADDPMSAIDIAHAMAQIVSTTCERLSIDIPHISIEPGRAIVGPSTFTLYEVGTVKTVNVEDTTGAIHQRRYISIDGGMSDNPRPVLYDANYWAVLASRRSSAPAVLSRVVGKHCESGDIVVRDVYLPDDVTAGDLLAVPATGAYCWVLASNYNYLGRPGVVAVNKGSARWIIRPETEEDLLARDMGVY